ncbi:PEGA domain-containing protein [Methanospirillum lacunae]|uniref:PEGA domain-containing protein n=1 Tax=Methanospirillum lacunae TaxID=668570 RepID=A0A2V2N8B5_9EURY|nr:PEGA domain-containing protein [Methanospirillum lacunae]PWR72748.1 hypothetical protein DK846_07295 [Methanospirillum lacunae]
MSLQSGFFTIEYKRLRVGVFALLLIFIICSIGGMVSAANPGYGYFKVDSAPQTGEVIFDGKSYGYTPALIQVNEDSSPSHEVVVKMEGYEEYSQQISYNPGRGQTVPISLDASHTLDHIGEFLSRQ